MSAAPSPTDTSPADAEPVRTTLKRVKERHYRVHDADGQVLGDVFWFVGGRCWQWIVPRLPQPGDNDFRPVAWDRYRLRRDAVDGLVAYHAKAAQDAPAG